MEARQTLWLAFFLLELRTVLFGLLLISSLARVCQQGTAKRIIFGKTCLFHHWRVAAGTNPSGCWESCSWGLHSRDSQLKRLVFFAVGGVAGLALGALEENTIQSRKKMIGFSIGYWRWSQFCLFSTVRGLEGWCWEPRRKIQFRAGWAAPPPPSNSTYLRQPRFPSKEN